MVDRLSPYEESVRFQENFATVSERLPVREWVVRLLEHHRRIQADKPPNGKAPWFERFDDGSYVIRPTYVREVGGLHEEEYMHAYRTTPLWSFAVDLGMVR